MEGLALGAQTTIQSAVVVLFAIAIHKGMAALVLGMKIAQMRTTFNLKLTYMFAFALASPVGILVGAAVQSKSSPSAASCVNGKELRARCALGD